MTASQSQRPDRDLGSQTQRAETHSRAEVLPFPNTSAPLSEVLAALTYALGPAAHEQQGYVLRCCVVGMNLGKRLQLQPEQSVELLFVLLLNGLDAAQEQTLACEWMGMPEALCRNAFRGLDWSKLEWPRVWFLMKYAFRDKKPLRRMLGVAGLLPPRRIALGLLTRQSFAGVRLARKLGLSTHAIQAMQCMDEHWDGHGSPRGLRRDAIPVLSPICCVAQDLVAFGDIMGRAQAVTFVERRSGRWYDPGVVTAAITMHETGTLWCGIDHEDLVGEIFAGVQQGAEESQPTAPCRSV